MYTSTKQMIKHWRTEKLNCLEVGGPRSLLRIQFFSSWPNLSPQDSIFQFLNFWPRISPRIQFFSVWAFFKCFGTDAFPVRFVSMWSIAPLEPLTSYHDSWPRKKRISFEQWWANSTISVAPRDWQKVLWKPTMLKAKHWTIRCARQRVDNVTMLLISSLIACLSTNHQEWVVSPESSLRLLSVWTR